MICQISWMDGWMDGYFIHHYHRLRMNGYQKSNKLIELITIMCLVLHILIVNDYESEVILTWFLTIYINKIKIMTMI